MIHKNGNCGFLGANVEWVEGRFFSSSFFCDSTPQVGWNFSFPSKDDLFILLNVTFCS